MLLCIAKLNEKGDGQHKDCEICNIEDIIDEKKKVLKDNIKLLEELEITFNEKMNELKAIFQKIVKDKEELKLDIQNIFTKIRNAINNREEELFIYLDGLFNDNYFNDDIIKKSEKLPKDIKNIYRKRKNN